MSTTAQFMTNVGASNRESEMKNAWSGNSKRFKQKGNDVNTTLHKLMRPRKPHRDGFESLGDIIRQYENEILHHRFDTDLSLKLDAAHLLREEMNGRRRA